MKVQVAVYQHPSLMYITQGRFTRDIIGWVVEGKDRKPIYQKETTREKNPDSTHVVRKAIDIANSSSGDITFRAPFDCAVALKISNYVLIVESVYPVLFADGSISYRWMELIHDDNTNYSGKYLQGSSFYKEGKVAANNVHVHVECGSGRYPSKSYVFEKASAVNFEDCLYVPPNVTIDPRGIDQYYERMGYPNSSDNPYNYRWSRLSRTQAIGIANRIEKFGKALIVSRTTNYYQEAILKEGVAIPSGQLKPGRYAALSSKSIRGKSYCEVFVRGYSYFAEILNGYTSLSSLEGSFSENDAYVLTKKTTNIYLQPGGNLIGTILKGTYLINGSPVIKNGFTWYPILVNGVTRYVRLIAGETELAGSGGSGLPTDRISTEWVTEKQREAAALEAQLAALKQQAAGARAELEKAEKRAKEEEVLRLAAEERVRATEGQADALVDSAKSDMTLHTVWKDTELATLQAYCEQTLAVAARDMRDEMNALQVVVMAMLATLIAKADRVRNPVNGKYEMLEKVFAALHDEHRKRAITAGDYAMLYLPAPDYDAYDMSAFVYDTQAQDILAGPLEHYRANSLNAREYHDKQMTAAAFDVYALTVQNYDTSAKMYYI